MSKEQVVAQTECVICYEILQKTNVCIPPCGHEFCFNCMMQHVQRNNGCPCCRAVLIENIVSEDEDEDDEEDENYETDSDVSSIEGDNEDVDDTYPIEQLVEAFTAKGYDLKDALSLLMYRYSKTDEKYTKKYIQTLETDIEDINEDLQNEYMERNRMTDEDNNVVV